jgi:hypothetical protein
VIGQDDDRKSQFRVDREHGLVSGGIQTDVPNRGRLAPSPWKIMNPYPLRCPRKRSGEVRSTSNGRAWRPYYVAVRSSGE